MIPINDRQKAEALMTVRNGADVMDTWLAYILRQIDSEHVYIGEPIGQYTVKESMPYFGAMATEEGYIWAKSVLKAQIKKV